jgi:hypothetical protein
LFDVYDLLSKHFVTWNGQVDLPTCQNVNKEIVWGHEMTRCMLLVMPIACAQRKSQHQCKWTETYEILIVKWKTQYYLNCKDNHTWHHDSLTSFILLNQQVQNMALLTIHTNYAKFHMHHL